MHIDISACGDAPCWVYSNENVSGQSFFCVLKKTQKYDCHCLYLLLCHNKITIDERLNGFIACIVLS